MASLQLSRLLWAALALPSVAGLLQRGLYQIQRDSRNQVVMMTIFLCSGTP